MELWNIYYFIIIFIIHSKIYLHGFLSFWEKKLVVTIQFKEILWIKFPENIGGGEIKSSDGESSIEQEERQRPLNHS